MRYRLSVCSGGAQDVFAYPPVYVFAASAFCVLLDMENKVSDMSTSAL